MIFSTSEKESSMTNAPPPARHRWTLHEIAVNDSRFFPAGEYTEDQVHAAAFAAKKRHGMTFRVRRSISTTTDGSIGAAHGWRVWRVA